MRPTMGRNMLDMAVLLVTSVTMAVIVDRHIIIPHIGQPSKKFRLSPIDLDRPEA